MVCNNLVSYKQEYLVDYDNASMMEGLANEKGFDILLTHLKPVIVGLTSSTLSPTELTQLTKVGFVDMFSVPITTNQIKREIVPFLKERQTIIQN